MIYFDHHATTPVASEVLEAMLPYFGDLFGNASSTSHAMGRRAAEGIEHATGTIARHLACDASEVVLTSGATESNNLAIFGVALHPRQKRRKVITIGTEHRSVLDPFQRLERYGFEVIRLPVVPQHEVVGQAGGFEAAGHEETAGMVEWEALEREIDERTALVSVMLANNEIGVLQPLSAIAERCRQWEIPLHTDATQAMGLLSIDVDLLGVDLLSFSAHKFYGPKGVGGLFSRHRDRRVKLDPQILGGGHQGNRRSGTYNVPGVIGMACALDRMERQREGLLARLTALRDQLWRTLVEGLADRVALNGPGVDGTWRLPNNLNCLFRGVDGESLMLLIPELAASSGAACSSAQPEPSHVLQALGRSTDDARCSLRFGLGAGNTAAEVELVGRWLIEAYWRLAGTAGVRED